MSGSAGHVDRKREPAGRGSTRRGASIRAPLGVFCWFLLTALAGGCEDLCVRNSDCPPGYVCEESGLCDVPPAPIPGEADAGAGETAAAADADDDAR